MKEKNTFDWIASYPHGVTVSDTEGIIIAMNGASCENFKKYGGEKLIGSSLFDCHPKSANTIIRNQLDFQEANTYITEKVEKTEKAEEKRLISQTPWYHADKTFGGLVETIIDLPVNMTVKKR